MRCVTTPILVAGLLLAQSATAAPDIPDYIQEGWRARLAGMAEKCELGDQSWAADLADGQTFLAYDKAPQEKALLGYIPTADSRKEIQGAIEAYVRIGRAISNAGAEACKNFASPNTLIGASAVIAGSRATKQKHTLPVLPPHLQEITMDVFTLELAGECNKRSESWTDAAFAASHAEAIDRTYIASDNGRSDDLHSNLLEEEGAIEGAVYAAQRVAVVAGDPACSGVVKWPGMARADARRIDYAKHPDKFGKHLKTPED